MSSFKSYSRAFLVLACIVVSVSALVNVYSDNADVLEKAKAVACPDKSCSPVRLERSPFAQTYDFRVGGTSVSVRCARGAVFFGDYACSK
jgi:hypothetical protein